jgi:hypothetical protein
MQRAVRLANVVDILGGTLDVLEAGIVRQGLPDMAERLNLLSSRRISGLPEIRIPVRKSGTPDLRWGGGGGGGAGVMF